MLVRSVRCAFEPFEDLEVDGLAVVLLFAFVMAGGVVGDEPELLLGVNTPQDLAKAEGIYAAG